MVLATHRGGEVLTSEVMDAIKVGIRVRPLIKRYGFYTHKHRILPFLFSVNIGRLKKLYSGYQTLTQFMRKALQLLTILVS